MPSVGGSSTGSGTRLSILPLRLWILVILCLVRTLSSASLPFPAQLMSTGPPQGRSALPDGEQFSSFPQNRDTAIRFGVSVVPCLGRPR